MNIIKIIVCFINDFISINTDIFSLCVETIVPVVLGCLLQRHYVNNKPINIPTKMAKIVVYPFLL
jgi:hypothetical protein